MTVTSVAPTAPAPPTLARPRVRGWIHVYSAAGALIAGAFLTALAAAARGPVAGLSCAAYALTLIGLFSVSAVYHRHTWISRRARTWMKRADHGMIFVFIAGTYTPVAVLALPDSTQDWVLPMAWAGAAGGVALKMMRPNLHRWAGVPCYLALGGVATFLIPQLPSRGPAPVALILAGGVLYCAGAVCYATRRPDPWPATFGYHEFFHAAVTSAAACQLLAICLMIAPR